jgi:hypothetical protein
MSDTTVTTEAPATVEPVNSLERDAGYVRLKDETKEAPSELTKDEAAQRLKELSAPEGSIRTFTSGLPDNIALSVEQAAEMVADVRRAEKTEAETDDVKAQRREVDKLRGDKPAPQIETEDDVERVLKSPKIRDAIAERVAESEKQRGEYETAVQHIGKERVAALHADFPEMQSVPLQNWAAAITEMHQREPARAAAIVTRLRALAEVEVAVQQIQADKTAREKAAFVTYAAEQNKKFAELTKGMSQTDLSAVKAEIPTMLKDYGVDDPRAFLQAIHGQSTFPRASAERILVDAAKYRMIMRAPKAVATRAVPNVMRPGIAGPRVDRGEIGLAALSAKLSKSGSLKDAVALRLARSKRG